MAKSITYRIRPSVDESLKYLADVAGKTKSAYLCDLVMKAELSELESVGGEVRVARSFYWDDKPEEKLAQLTKATGASRPEIVEWLIEQEAQKFKGR